MTMIIIGLLIIGFLVYFTMFHKKGDKITIPTPKTKEEKENTSFENGINKLIKINLESRKNILQKDVLLVLESTIDSIRNITEEMSKYKNFSESSVMFNRIIDKYLPDLINGYLGLDDKERESNSKNIIKDLERLKKEVLLIEDSLKESSTQDFEKTGKLIEAMFQKFEGGEV